MPDSSGYLTVHLHPGLDLLRGAMLDAVGTVGKDGRFDLYFEPRQVRIVAKSLDRRRAFRKSVPMVLVMRPAKTAVKAVVR